MRFTEKLKRLTADRHKNKVSARAGLPPSAIYDYIAKGHTPSAANALKIAVALEVDLEWLVDDHREWPPVRRGVRMPEPIQAA